MYDEYPSIKQTLNHTGVKSDVIVPTREEFFEHFEDAVRTLGRTTIHYSLVPLYLLFKRAKELGLKTESK